MGKSKMNLSRVLWAFSFVFVYSVEAKAQSVAAPAKAVTAPTTSTRVGVGDETGAADAQVKKDSDQKSPELKKGNTASTTSVPVGAQDSNQAKPVMPSSSTPSSSTPVTNGSDPKKGDLAPTTSQSIGGSGSSGKTSGSTQANSNKPNPTTSGPGTPVTSNQTGSSSNETPTTSVQSPAPVSTSSSQPSNASSSNTPVSSSSTPVSSSSTPGSASNTPSSNSNSSGNHNGTVSSAPPTSTSNGTLSGSSQVGSSSGPNKPNSGSSDGKSDGKITPPAPGATGTSSSSNGTSSPSGVPVTAVSGSQTSNIDQVGAALNNKPKPGSCEDQSLQQIYALILADHDNVLATMFELTAMRLAKRSLEQTPKATTLEEQTTSKIDILNKKIESIKSAGDVQEQVKKIYQTYGGKKADVELIEKDFNQFQNQNKDACYWSKNQRLTNRSVSAFVLAASVGEKDSGLSEIDAATIWVVERARAEAAEKDKEYKIGKAKGNLLNISTRVARYLGRIDDARNPKSSEVLKEEIEQEEKKIKDAIFRIYGIVKEKLKGCILEDVKSQKNKECVNCAEARIAQFEKERLDLNVIQKGLLEAVSRSDGLKVDEDLKLRLKDTTYDFSNFAQSKEDEKVLQNPRRGKFDACGHVLPLKAGGKKSGASVTPSPVIEKDQIGIKLSIPKLNSKSEKPVADSANWVKEAEKLPVKAATEPLQAVPVQAKSVPASKPASTSVKEPKLKKHMVPETSLTDFLLANHLVRKNFTQVTAPIEARYQLFGCCHVYVPTSATNPEMSFMVGNQVVYSHAWKSGQSVESFQAQAQQKCSCDAGKISVGTSAEEVVQDLGRSLYQNELRKSASPVIQNYGVCTIKIWMPGELDEKSTYRRYQIWRAGKPLIPKGGEQMVDFKGCLSNQCSGQSMALGQLIEFSQKLDRICK